MRPNDSNDQNPTPSTPALGCGQTASGVPGVPVEGQLAFEGSRSTEGVKSLSSQGGANGGALEGESASQSPRADAQATDNIAWTIKPAVDIAAQVITLDIHTKMKDMTDTVTRELCNLKEEAVRRALIVAGWTPPESNAEASTDAGAGSQFPQTGWISVRERMPPPDDLVLCTGATSQIVDTMLGRYLRNWVTHWMPLPAPPPPPAPSTPTTPL